MMLEDRNWYERESGYTRDGTDYYAYIERTGIDLDELTGNALSVKRINRLVPQMQGTGTVNIQVGAAMSPYDSPTWGPTVSFTLGTDYKADTRVTGRYMAYRIGSWEGTALNNQWSLSGMDVDVIMAGNR